MVKWKALCGAAVALTAACVTGSTMEDVGRMFPDDQLNAESYRTLLATGDFGNSFNTSIAFTVPLFSFQLPAAEDNTFNDLESQAVTFLAALAFVVIGSIAVLPALYDILGIPVSRSDNSLVGSSSLTEYIVNFLDKSLDSLPSTDGEECIKRAVCEAHNHPRKYGLLALPVLLMFPPSQDIGNSRLSGYYKAAQYGRSGTAECTLRYPKCFFNLLDAFQYITKFIVKTIF